MALPLALLLLLLLVSSVAEARGDGSKKRPIELKDSPPALSAKAKELLWVNGVIWPVVVVVVSCETFVAWRRFSNESSAFDTNRRRGPDFATTSIHSTTML